MKKPPVVAQSKELLGTSAGSDTAISPLLARLRSPDAQAAWEDFLVGCGAIIYQAVRPSAREEEEAADCFVFVCGKLAENGYRRLLRFKPEGVATFATWLRVVVRNLCFDWHRSVLGRPRPFKFLQELSAMELEVYYCKFERRLSSEETLRHLHITWPALTEDTLNKIESRIAGSLTPRQRWILSTRLMSKKATSLDVDEEDERPLVEIADPTPDPEAAIFTEQQQIQLEHCLEALLPDERLIVRLRFEDELSLQEIAHLMGLGDAQRVQRRLLAVIKILREAMGK